MSAPRNVEELKVPRKLLEDLALKSLYVHGELTLFQLAEHMRISLKIVDELFQRLRKDQLVQVTGMVGGIHQVVTTSEGKTRALELLSQSQYVGPVPVALPDYVERTHAQSVRRIDVHPDDVTQAFERLVLDAPTLRQVGTAVVSGRAIFLYGPPGTGKTTVAETIWQLYDHDPVYVPHAVTVDGQIITVYDPGVHHSVDQPASHEYDRRPRVLAGGELTIEMLDLQFNPATRFYAAPLQMKANNGLLIIDDFGRQRVRPEELLNRWVVPLDRSIDFLTLTGGKKIELPFDSLVVFATNIDPASLVDEAFLRRIQTKIRLDNVPPEQFHEIMRRVCGEYELTYDRSVVEHLIDYITRDLGQPLRACYPRDLVNQICWAARYSHATPRFDLTGVTEACRAYFIEPDARGMAVAPEGRYN
jgi:predicted ATPase with chaperone activity